MTERIEGNGGDLVLAALRGYGVREMFTLSGGHVFPLYDAAHRAGDAADGQPVMRIVDVRHEQSAVFAAEAVAKLQRRPGLAVLTAGPGVTNGISGLTSAYFNASPVLVLGAGHRPSGGARAASRRSTTCRWSRRSPSTRPPSSPPRTSRPRSTLR